MWQPTQPSTSQIHRVPKNWDPFVFNMSSVSVMIFTSLLAVTQRPRVPDYSKLQDLYLYLCLKSVFAATASYKTSTFRPLPLSFAVCVSLKYLIGIHKRCGNHTSTTQMLSRRECPESLEFHGWITVSKKAGFFKVSLEKIILNKTCSF